MALQRLTPATQQSILRSHSRMEVRGHRQPPLDTTHCLVSLKHIQPLSPPAPMVPTLKGTPHIFWLDFLVFGFKISLIILSLYIIDRIQQRNTSPTF